MAEYPYEARATLKFKGPPGSSDSLSFQKGDLITVLGLADEDGEWLKGRDSQGNEGMFPEQFVEKVDEFAAEEPVQPAVEEATPVSAPETVKSPPLKQDKPFAPASSDAPEPAKGGSFKDRIAAFNKPAAGPPPVKAKPPTIGRKPQPAPSAQPKPDMPATSTSESRNAQGLSASDAKESIAKGGSLKDRIAALQGGFKAEHMQPPAPGKAPPKPWKKPAPAPEEKPASPSTPKEEVEVLEPQTEIKEEKPDESEAPARSLSPPSTVPMPAIPRRTGPPRRRAPAAVTPKKEEEKQLGQEEITLSQPDDIPDDQQPPPEAGESRQVPLEERVQSEPNLQSLNLDEGGPKSPTIREPEQTLSVVPPSHSRTSSSDSLQPPSPMHKPSLPLPPRLETEKVDEALEEEQSKRSPPSPNELRAPEPMHQPSLPIPAARDALPGSEGQGGTMDEPGKMDEELVDEEEQERKRKESIMKRMAAMGGQKIGAPMMPTRKATAPLEEDGLVEEPSVDSTEADQPRSATESSAPQAPMRMPPPPARSPSDGSQDEDEPQETTSDNEQTIEGGEAAPPPPARLPPPPMQPKVDSSDDEREGNSDMEEEAPSVPARVPPSSRLPPPPVQPGQDQSESEDERIEESAPLSPTRAVPQMPPIPVQHTQSEQESEEEASAPQPPPRALPRPPVPVEAEIPSSPTRKPSLPPINTASRPAVPQARRYSQDVTSPPIIESARESKASTSPISPRRDSYRAPTPTSPRPPIPQAHSRQQSMVFDEEEEEDVQSIPMPTRKLSKGSPKPPVPQHRMSMSFDEPVSPPPLSPRMSMSGVASIPMRAPVQEEEPVVTEEAPAIQAEATEPTQELTEEEEEAERRQRIAARMAKLGGLKMGMLPMHAAPKSAKPQTPVESEAESPIDPPTAQKRTSALQGGVALPGISMPRPTPREPSPEPEQVTEQMSQSEAQENEAPEEVITSPISPRPPVPSRALPSSIDTSVSSRPLPDAPEDDIPMPQSPPPPARPSGGHSRQSSLAAPVSALSMADSDEGRRSLDTGSQDSHGSAARQSFDAPRQSMDAPRQSVDAPRQSMDLSRPLPPQPTQSSMTESTAMPTQDAPISYSDSDLISFSERIGTQIFVKARAKSKEGGRWLGDSGPANFVAAVLSEVPDAQIPTNFNYGALIWSSQMGTIPNPSQIRLGDIFVAHHAKIKNRGIGSHSTQLGSANAPYASIVSDDYDTKKSKIRVFEVSSGEVKAGGHHLDQLKEGLLQVYRVVPRA